MGLQDFFFVFWPILIMLESGWFPLVFWFPSFRVFLPRFLGLFLKYQLQLVSLSPSCSTIFWRSLARSTYLSRFSFSLIFKVHYLADSLFLLTITRSDLQVGIRWSVYISKFQWIMCSTFSRALSCCAYTICFYGKILIFCTILRGSSPPAVSSLILLFYSFESFSHQS